MFCPKCGLEVDPNSNFCQHCGAALSQEAVSAEGAAAAAPRAQAGVPPTPMVVTTGAPVTVGAPATYESAAMPEERTLFTARPSLATVVPRIVLWVLVVVAIYLGLLFGLPQANIRIGFLQKPAGQYIVLLLLCIFPLATILARLYKVISVRYRLSTQRLFIDRGILSRRTDEFELERYRDILMSQDFLDKIVGCGDIRVMTGDETTPAILLYDVRNPLEKKETIRTAARERKVALGILRREDL